jgi:hypothetical protein
MTEHTKDMLAQALREVGLEEMAEKAATGFYHDYLSPLDMPETQLINDLAQAAAMEPGLDRAKKILALRGHVINGDFDATAEEGDAWARSPEGQAAFRLLQRKS